LRIFGRTTLEIQFMAVLGSRYRPYVARMEQIRAFTPVFNGLWRNAG
jgi:hypothetical protein